MTAGPTRCSIQTPGKFFSYSGNLPFDPVGGTMINIPGNPTILGYWTSSVVNDKHGYGISRSPLYAVDQCHHCIERGHRGYAGANHQCEWGSWSSINGRTFLVGANPTQRAIPLTIDGTKPFDCSSLGTLSSLKLTYIGSSDYVNFLRDRSYASPQISSVQKAFYNDFFKFGGGGASQLNVADLWGSPWRSMGDDMEGYMTVAACTKCSISNGVLTLGGAVSGRFETGTIITGANQPGGSASVTITDYISGDGSKPGDKLSLSTGSVRMVNRPLRSTVHYPPGKFPLIEGMHEFNLEHGVVR